MNIPDHYDVLGISPEADSAAVDQAYWGLVRQRRDLEAADPEALDRLNEAYEVLATPRLRREYDESRQFQTSRADESRAPDATKKARVSKLWPQGGLMRFVEDADAELEPQSPPESIVARGPQDSQWPAAAHVPGEADQLRSSTASLVERWRTSHMEMKGWALLSDR